jgi:integrase
MYVEKELCIVKTLCEYLDRTKLLRQDKKLFISTMKPHKGVSRDTISRWIRDTMKLSGIDASKFCPHSTRAAATTAAHKAGVTIDIIMEKAGWSNASTFHRFYNKPLQQSAQFTESILKSVP